MKKPDKALSAKLRKTGGFTLIEMLIVVAVIAVLIAVSIPLINGALEKSRDATDMANERAAKAEAAMLYLGAADLGDLAGDRIGEDAYQILQTEGLGFVYDADKGAIVLAIGDGGSKDIGPYGKCTDCDNDNYPNHGDHRKSVIAGWIATNGQITIEWLEAPVQASDIKGVENGRLQYSGG